MNREKNDAPQIEKEEHKHRAAYTSGNGRGPQKDSNRRWLFLVVDVVLLIAIVVAIIFLISLLTPLKIFESGKTENKTVVYTVEMTGVQRNSIGSLHVGDVVTDAETGCVIGVVTAVSSRPYEVYTDTPTDVVDEGLNSHVVTKVTYPEEFNTVTVTLTVDAEYTEGIGYAVEDCRIAVGKDYHLRFPGYADEGVCVEIQAE